MPTRASHGATTSTCPLRRRCSGTTKPDAEYLAHVNEGHLRDWYREKDLLPNGLETVIDAASTLDDTVQQILSESGLDGILPIDR